MKKVFSLLLSMMLLAASCFTTVALAEDTTSGGDTLPQPTDAKVYVYSYDKTVVRSGDVTAFPMVIGCRAAYDAYDMRLSVTGDGDYAGMFSFQDGTGWYNVSQVGDRTKVTPTLVVSSSVPDGKYKLNFTFQYYDSQDNSYSVTDSCWINVYGKSDDFAYIKSAAFDKGEIGKENKSKLTVHFVNPTKSTIYNMKVSFNAGKSEGFSLYENFRPTSVASMNPGESKSATFSVYVASSVATGNYPLTFDISYEDPSGHISAFTDTIYAQVTRSADAGGDGKGSQPRIIVSKYSTDVEQVQAGKDFTLDFALQNTSSEMAVSNIKVVLGSVPASNSGTTTSASKDVFFPAAGSNSFFIEKIAPKQSASNQIKLMTSQDVEPGVYALTLDIQYDCTAANGLTSTEQISFPVNQTQRLEVQGLNLPTDGMAGSSIPLSFQYINKGKATIYNFSVAVEGDFSLADGDTYIGNLTAGYNDSFDGGLVSNGEGELKGTLVLKYEDSQGTEKEERTEFTVNVAPMDMGVIGGIGGGMIDPETGFPIDPETGEVIDPATGLPLKKGGILPIILWSAGGVLVVGGGVAAFLIIRKKRKTKKELVEDEED